MANFSLVADSKFQPFSYQELLAPVARMSEVHEAIAEQYDKLSSQADILEAMGKNDKDKKSGVYSQYQAYSNALREEADNLYRNGLNYDSRMRLSDLRRRYNKEIVPIQNAWNERKQEADTQMKARLQNPSLRFTRDAANSSLEEYINNPMGGYGVVDLKTVTAQMAGMSKNLEKKILSSKGQLEGIDAYTYNYINRFGLDANIINEWINNPDSSPTLTNMMNQVLAANGLNSDQFRNSPNGASLLAEATNAAQMGAWEAIGEDKSQVIENYGSRKALEHSYAVDMENRRHAHAIAEKQAPSYSDLYSTGDGGLSADLFNRQPGTLPIAVADGDISNIVGNNAEAFGFRKSKKDPKGYEVTYMTISPYKLSKGVNLNRVQRISLSRMKDIRISLFDEYNENKVKNWKQFSVELSKLIDPKASQSDRDAIMNQAKTQFLNAVNTAKSIGLNPKKGYTTKDVVSALQQQYDTGAAGYIKGYNWNHKNTDWNSTAQKMRVQEIRNLNHDGRMTFSSKGYTLADLLNTGTSAEINKNGQDVHAFVSNQRGQKGVIFTVGNRQFFAPKDVIINSNFNGARAFELLDNSDKLIQQAEQIESSNPSQATTWRAIAASNSNEALSLLETGLVLKNSNPTQDVVSQPTAAQNGFFK